MEIYPQRAATLVLHLIQELDKSQNDYETAMVAEADCKEVLSVTLAVAWSEVEGRSREERTAYVEAECAEIQRFTDYATLRAKAMAKRVDGKRQALSSLQTVGRMIEEESQHSRMGPDASPMSPDEAEATLAMSAKIEEMEAERRGSLSGREAIGHNL